MKFSKRQIEIINASTTLIAKKGIQGFTIKNLADKIGISEPALYRHFKNKTEILLNILTYFKQNMEALLNKNITKDLSNINKIKFFFTGHFAKIVENPTMAAIIFSENIFQNENILSQEIISMMQSKQKKLKKIIINGQKNGEIRSDIDKNELVIIILGTLRLLVKKWYLTEYSTDLIKEGNKSWNSIQKIIKKEETK